MFDIANFKCIKDRNKIRFQGNPVNSVQHKFPLIWVQACVGEDYCKTEEEITNFVKDVYMSVIVKTSNYDPD